MEHVSYFQKAFREGFAHFPGLPVGLTPAQSLPIAIVLLLHDVLREYDDALPHPTWKVECENSFRRVIVMAMAATLAATLPGKFGQALAGFWAKAREELVKELEGDATISVGPKQFRVCDAALASVCVWGNLPKHTY